MQAPRSSGFRPCPTCDGMGFLRKGDFADRTFPVCVSCKGLAQIYLEPIPEPKPDALTSWRANVYCDLDGYPQP